MKMQRNRIGNKGLTWMLTPCMALALLAPVVTRADSPSNTELLVNTTFQGDPVNPNPRTALGTPPANWSVSSVFSNANGLVDVSVEGVGSPFNGGSSKSALLFDNNAANGPFILQGFFAPQTNIGLVISMDVRFHSVLIGGQGNLALQMVSAGNHFLGGIYFASSPTLDSEQLANLQTGQTLGTLDTGIWYRVQLVMPAASSANTNMVVTLTDFPTLTTTTNTVYTGRTGPMSDGYYRAIFSSGFGAPNEVDANLDNVSIVTVPEPAGALLLILGGLTLLGHVRARAQRERCKPISSLCRSVDAQRHA